MLIRTRLVAVALLLPPLLLAPSSASAAPSPVSSAAPTSMSQAGANARPLSGPSVDRRRYKPRNDKTFKVVSSSSYRSNHDITIYADVKNRTRTWRTHVWATVTFYNKRGKRIGDGVTSPEQLYARPRGHMSMKYYWTRVPKGYHHYRITLTSKRAKKSERPVGNVGVQIHQPWIDPDTGLQVPITVVNHNSRGIRHVAVYVTLFSDKGKIVATSTGYNYTEPSELAPGQSGTFVAQFGDRYADVTRINAMVEAGFAR